MKSKQTNKPAPRNGASQRPSVRVQRLARPEAAREYEPYGDEWRKEVMKIPKAMLIELFRTEAMLRRGLIGPSHVI